MCPLRVYQGYDMSLAIANVHPRLSQYLPLSGLLSNKRGFSMKNINTHIIIHDLYLRVYGVFSVHFIMYPLSIIIVKLGKLLALAVRKCEFCTSAYCKNLNMVDRASFFSCNTYLSNVWRDIIGFWQVGMLVPLIRVKRRL